MTNGLILVVDDEEEMIQNYSRIIRKLGYECIAERDSTAVAERVKQSKPDLILTDLRMPVKSGFDILTEARDVTPYVPVILVTAYADIPTAVEAVKRGAFDFIAKPFSSDQLAMAIDRAFRQKSLSDENRRLKEQLRTASLCELVGKSPAILEVEEVIRRVAETDANVLITGESGTGKELVAKAIHARSLRKAGPFIPVDCAALPENLLESELFGYEKGAFTGAATGRQGLFETANRGTLFLDEIGEVPVTMQVKLLRALQERQIRRLGSNTLSRIDVRVLSATNRNLQKSVAERMFREDLFFRLNVIHIHVPPLRERKGDISLLSSHFLNVFSASHRKQINSISPEAMEVLEQYRWPGNIRELQNTIERAVVLSSGSRIEVVNLPKEISANGSIASPPRLTENLDFKQAKEQCVASFEKNYLTALLDSTEGNISRAAKKAGIDRKTMHRLMKRYNVASD
ncbi:MAG TPA: sigma-54 dependent transcriptional regulator [Nitrospirota bacterium]|nr:sigma-54 dependent transcriptional regulator [Nitrospirota bacterium]